MDQVSDEGHGSIYEIESGVTFDIDRFKSLMHSLLRSKIRASFNCKFPKGEHITSRNAFFSELEFMGRRALEKNRILGGEMEGREGYDFLKLARKMTPWNSPDFYVDSTPISDSRFKCINNSMLEKGEGLLTYSGLKRKAIKASRNDSNEEQTCRSCTVNINGYSINNRGKLMISENALFQADCVLNPLIEKNGLGITVEISYDVENDEFHLDEIELGTGISREFEIEKLLLGDDSMDSLRISRKADLPREIKSQTVRMKVISTDSDSNDIRQIWGERGYKENIRSEIRFEEDLSPMLFQERTCKSFNDVLSGIEGAWNPLFFRDPSQFLMIVESHQDGRDRWPVKYIEMGKKMQRLLENELQNVLHNPIVGVEQDGCVVFSLDNIEFWR
jgi:hypothetical protein